MCVACGMPLRVDYDLSGVQLKLAGVRKGPPSLWRYRELLPLGENEEISLLEGFTPLLRVESNVWVKDEGRNPTHSLEARGMSVAVSMAKHLGARELSVPSSGNAASALAAYGSRGGLPVTVAIPEDALETFGKECEFYGATVHRVKGMIDHAARFLQEHGPKDAFNLAALHEPYRIEGQKTLAYELVEQMEGEVPDVIVCANGEGTTLIAMWKAFDEMERLGWIAVGKRPRLVDVQAAGCPLAEKALQEVTERAGSSHRASRVHTPLGSFISQRALRETNGTAVKMTEAEMERAAQTLASCTGIDVSPEGGAAWAALMKLREDGFVRESDSVVVVNNATGLKYR